MLVAVFILFTKMDGMGSYCSMRVAINRERGLCFDQCITLGEMLFSGKSQEKRVPVTELFILVQETFLVSWVRIALDTYFSSRTVFYFPRSAVIAGSRIILGCTRS